MPWTTKKRKKITMKERFKNTIAMVTFIASSFVLFGQEELQKEYHQTYPLLDGTSVEIENRYGDIEINTWEKDSVAFHVEVTVNTSNNLDLDEMLEEINVDFNSNKSLVRAETNWAEDVTFFKKEFRNIKEGILGMSDNIEVNYEVYLPSNCELEINNKFGDVLIDEFDGELRLKLEYGDLRAQKLGDIKRIEQKYGKLKIHEMNDGFLILTGVKSAHIIKAHDLIMESSSCDLEFEEVNELDIISRHDEIRIEQINSMGGKQSLTDINIRELDERCSLDCKYGSVYIKKVNNTTQLVNLTGNRTDITLKYAEDFDSNFNIAVDEQAKLVMSPEINIIKKVFEEKNLYRVTANKGANTNNQVSINATKGYVRIGN